MKPPDFPNGPNPFPNVRSLDEKRAEKSGAAFGLTPWEYDDDALGFIDGDHPVVFVFDGNNGIAMTRETATKLRDALSGVLFSPHAPWRSSPSGGEGT